MTSSGPTFLRTVKINYNELENYMFSCDLNSIFRATQNMVRGFDRFIIYVSNACVSPPARGDTRTRSSTHLVYSRLRAVSQGDEPQPQPPWSQVEGKSQVNLPQMPPLQGGICMGVDQRNHLFFPGLPPGRSLTPSKLSLNQVDETLTFNDLVCFGNSANFPAYCSTLDYGSHHVRP